MHRTYIGLGSNIGNKTKNLKNAIKYLKEYGTVTNCSSFYTTKPWGYLNQDDFENAVVEFNTLLSPKSLLLTCKEIEKDMGRKPAPKNYPRIIDLDILLYKDKIINTPGLTIPHPGMHERSTVLEPLCEIAPEVIHPVLHKTAQELFESLG